MMAAFLVTLPIVAAWISTGILVCIVRWYQIGRPSDELEYVPMAIILWPLAIYVWYQN